MGYKTIFATANADTNRDSDSIEFFTKGKTSMALQIVATGLNAADATVKVQESNDGTNWVDVSGASITLASGASYPVLSITPRCRFNRYVYTKGTVSAGTFSGIVNFN